MKELHLICNAHIDPVWHWHFNEGIGCAISTFRVAAELCEDEANNAFVFNHNEAILYRYIERLDPELFARIKKLVSEGKWHIIGGWYLQPDCNKLSGESFVRQITRGQKYFKEKFGVCPTTAINFDAFGHTVGLIQILDKCGYDSYLFSRPNYYSGTTDMPARIFKWNGYADSSVTAANQYPYNSTFGKIEWIIKNYMNQNKESDQENHFLLWGVGNHGGGPSKQDLETISRMMGEKADFKIIHSTPEDYFKKLHAENHKLPEFSKSLDKVMVGCYTSQSKVKKLHRELENSLKMAEMMATHASIAAGREYPYDRIEEIEDCLLLSQFHDILPGSSSMAAMESAMRTTMRGLDIAEEVKTEAFYALTSGQPKGERYVLPLLVYNSTPYEEEFEIENEFTLADQNYSDQFNQVTIMQGDKVIPSQLEQDTSNIPIDWRKRVLFNAKLQPMSMNRFNMVVEMIDKKPEKKLYDGKYITVGNDNFTFSIDTETGLIEKYEVDGVPYLKSGAGKLAVINDNQDPWGMLVTEFRDFAGYFTLATPEEATKLCNVEDKLIAPVRVIDDGDIRTVIEAVFCYETSYAVIRYFISKSDSQVKVNIKLFSQLKHKTVKFSLPTAFESPTVSAKTAFGMEELRTDGTEVVSQEYVIMSENDKALSIVKQGIYGADTTDGEMRLTLIRAANYCAHPLDGKRFTTPQDRFNDVIDTGESRFDFAFNASSLSDRKANIEKESVKLGQAPETICFYPSGTGTAPKPLCTVTNNLVSVERIFMDKNSRYIVHLYNSSEAPTETEVILPALDTSFKANLKGFEILAFAVSKDGKTQNIAINE